MFRRLRVAFLFLGLAGPALACNFDDAVATEVVAATNAYRADQGRRALTIDAALTRAARAHACELVETSRFSHDGANGSGVGDRVSASGYGWRFVAENIALGQRGAQAVVSGWIGSRGHRRNLLSRDATQIGVASVPTSRGPMWVMVLAAPR
ncbi:MAG: CAP domain-containing protein [Pseudomonadota bacterium]